MLSKKLIFLSLLVITGVLANNLYFENYGIDGANLAPTNLQFAATGCYAPTGVTIAGTTTLTTMENGSTTITTTSLDGTFLVTTQSNDGTVTQTETTKEGTAITTTTTDTGKVTTTTTKISGVEVEPSGEVKIIPVGGDDSGDDGGDAPDGSSYVKGKSADSSPIYFESAPPFPVGTQLSCGAKIGECGGTITCQADGTWTDCTAIQPGNIKEICGDGKDNDCDGTIDEDCVCLDGETRECGSNVGVCKYGKETCKDGVWSVCTGGIVQTRETCGDGLDNDCDSIVDNSCECTSGETKTCGTNIGACTSGVQKCVNQIWTVCNGAIEPKPESCLNRLDDDCDGVINQNCKEMCDGIDNDSDGETDEGCPVKCEIANIDGKQHCCQQVNTAGDFIYDQGHCSPILTDVSGDVFLLIGGLDYLSAEVACEEVCGDGKDNDCDGEIDESCGLSVDTVSFEVFPKRLILTVKKGNIAETKISVLNTGTDDVCPSVIIPENFPAGMFSIIGMTDCVAPGEIKTYNVLIDTTNVIAKKYTSTLTIHGSDEEYIDIEIDVCEGDECETGLLTIIITSVSPVDETSSVYGTKSVLIQWNAFGENLSFKVERTMDGGLVWIPLDEGKWTPNINSFNDDTIGDLDDACANEENIIYRVSAKDDVNDPVSDQENLSCEDEALPAPQNLIATSIAAGVYLEWDAVSGADNYIIYRSYEPVFEVGPEYFLGRTIKRLNYTDTTCIPNETCFYKVTACKQDGSQDDPPQDPICGDGICNGDEDYLSCPEDCPLPAPQNLSPEGITYGYLNSEIMGSWDAVPGATKYTYQLCLPANLDLGCGWVEGQPIPEPCCADILWESTTTETNTFIVYPEMANPMSYAGDGQWKWRVRAENDIQTSAWSSAIITRKITPSIIPSYGSTIFYKYCPSDLWGPGITFDKIENAEEYVLWANPGFGCVGEGGLATGSWEYPDTTDLVCDTGDGPGKTCTWKFKQDNNVPLIGLQSECVWELTIYSCHNEGSGGPGCMYSYTNGAGIYDFFGIQYGKQLWVWDEC